MRLKRGLLQGLAYVARHVNATELNEGKPTAKTAYSEDEFKLGIGIVTPHKARKVLVVRKLLELFPKADPKAVFESVDTVERFRVASAI